MDVGRTAHVVQRESGMTALIVRLGLHRRPGLGFVIGWVLALGLSVVGVVSVNGFWPVFIWILTTLVWAALLGAAASTWGHKHLRWPEDRE